MIAIGTTVKYSQHKLRDTESRLGYGGPNHQRNVNAHKAAQAKRGEVISHAPNKFAQNVLKVKWDDGTFSEMLDYLVEKA